MVAGRPASGFSCGPCAVYYDNFGNFDFYNYYAMYEAGSEMCNVGKIDGLNAIKEIPESTAGWATQMSAKKGYGYVIKGYYHGGVFGSLTGETFTEGPYYYGIYVVDEGYNSLEVKYYQMFTEN